ncbi:MAG TPA: pantoate--beta-alanine ligase [Candidatus Nanopelagicaceae bacterium]
MTDSTSLVPTMGALHAGHLELIKRARELSADVIVSIFVNPLQFENQEDLEKYPRDLKGDTEKALAAGATRVWAPTYEEIYPSEITKISAGKVGEIFEGKERRGHFDGMLTVVSRLFDLVKPRFAIFGEKDFQQLFIVNKWIQENQIPIEIVRVPTVRGSGGIALSSRNQRLKPADLQTALIINKALRTGTKAGILEVLATEPNFRVDYAEVIDDETFEVATPDTQFPRGIIAGWVNGIRLIDNMLMTKLPAGSR